MEYISRDAYDVATREKKVIEKKKRKGTNYSMLRTWCHMFKDVSRVSTK